MNRNFAKGLTKDDLIKMGIKDIYFNPYDLQYHVINKKDKEVSLYQTHQQYIYFVISDLDDQGQYIKKPLKSLCKGCTKVSHTYRYKTKTIYLHRAIYAWLVGDVPQGMIVDHIDNQHETHYDNRPENLQLLTQAENISKEISNYRASDIKKLKKTVREAHEAYTKNRTLDNRYVWKLSIENLKKYLELHPLKS